jgi:hypothetical protein
VPATTGFLKVMTCTNYITMTGSIPAGDTVGPGATVGFTFNASPAASQGIQFVYQSTGEVDFMVATLAGVSSWGMGQLDTNKLACLGPAAWSMFATYTLPAAVADTTVAFPWNDARLVGLTIDPAQILFVQWGQSRGATVTTPSVAATFSVKIKDVTLY